MLSRQSSFQVLVKIDIYSLLVEFVNTHISGGYCGGVPPLPIPNREVKPACADGTAMQCGRVGSRLLLMSLMCPDGCVRLNCLAYPQPLPEGKGSEPHPNPLLKEREQVKK